jgi:hypothetical protein
MDIDLNTPNVEQPAPPAITAPTRKQNRRRSPLALCHTAKPIGFADCASSSFDVVPEARQIYPTEDDRTGVRRHLRRALMSSD